MFGRTPVPSKTAPIPVSSAEWLFYGVEAVLEKSLAKQLYFNFFNGLKMSNDQYTLSLTCLAKQLHLCLRKIHATAPPGVPSDAIASLLRKN